MDTDVAGWRGRLGILVIDRDAIAEAEFWAMAPSGMSVHSARFEPPSLDWSGGTTENPARVMVESADLARSLDFLRRIGLDAICLCYTTSSFYGGTEFDREFSKMAAPVTTGADVFTSAAAMQSAIRALGVREPFVITPAWFTNSMTEAAERYFAADDFKVAGSMRFDLGPGWEKLSAAQTWEAGAQWEVRATDVYRQVKRAFPDGADGVVIPGNGFGSAKSIALLEADLGVPVITANQACMWYFLQTTRTRVPIAGYGCLLSAPVTLVGRVAPDYAT